MEIAHHHDQELSNSQSDTLFYQFDSFILLQTLINSIAMKYEQRQNKYTRNDLISKKILRACKNYYMKYV
jgi:ribosomal protein L17